ncbi:MAG: hypothetical protein RL011_165, partial [Pseudomonadota bacterium]
MVFPLDSGEAVWFTGSWNLLFFTFWRAAPGLGDFPMMVVR